MNKRALVVTTGLGASILTLGIWGPFNAEKENTTPILPTTSIVKSSTVETTANPVELSRPTICIEHTLQGWDLSSSINRWNSNGNTLLAVVPSKNPCIATVSLSITNNDGFWGRTTVTPKREIIVQISTQVTPNNREHVLCHELGHVLGVSHHMGDSCMNDQQTLSYPSDSDLNLVRQTTWTIENVRRQLTVS